MSAFRGLNNVAVVGREIRSWVERPLKRGVRISEVRISEVPLYNGEAVSPIGVMCAQNNEKVVTMSYDRYGKAFLIAHNSRWEVMTSGRDMLPVQVIGPSHYLIAAHFWTFYIINSIPL